KVSMEELGGARQQARNGNISYVAATEEEAFNYTKDLLDFLPSSAFDELPQYWAPNDSLTERDKELNSIIPDDPNAGYDMMDVLTRIFDDENGLEVQGDYGANVITADARTDGQADGQTANQPTGIYGC